MNRSKLVNNLMVVEGDVLDNCKVIDDNRYYYFLEKNGGNTFYDIVLPKVYCNKILKYKKGDKFDVVVDAICIADDGYPGAFVKPYQM